MTTNQNKVIVTCALTGSVHTPTMSEYLPITPEEIAQQAIDAAAAGAAILHLHARNPEDGRPTPDPEIFQRFVPRIAAHESVPLRTFLTTRGRPAVLHGAPSRPRHPQHP